MLINDMLGKNVKTCQDIIGECGDYIKQYISDAFTSPMSTCEQCKTDLHAGLGGTIEYAVRCAGACIDETTKICSQSDPTTADGVPCTMPDGSPGTYQNCVCVADTTTGGNWVGYCNALTGEVIVVEQGKGTVPPDSTRYRLILLRPEHSRRPAECTSRSSVIPSTLDISQGQPIPFPSLNCSLGQYYDQSAIAASFQWVALQ